ncbi:MAG TPA: ArsA-related P-loop ATPase [Terriglobia bacterium]|nr:ArsA-related P-loop ATPase [Terriglobia bacterium]
MNLSSQDAALTIFCGKGGVGKTTIALAYAMGIARRSRRVLVVTSHPLAELAVSVSLAGMKEQDPAAAAHLFIIHIDPFELLARRVEQAIPSRPLVQRVLNSAIYRNLVEVAPGLKEISFLGRLHELASRRSTGEDKEEFSELVWDAPATGHFLQTMKVSRNFEKYLSGPLALIGKEVGIFFGNPSNLAVIPVTTLERMAVDETIEMCEKLAGELNARPAAVVVNMASPLIAGPQAASEEFFRWVSGAGAQAAHLAFIAERHRIERAQLARLRSSVDAPVQFVRRASGWTSDLELLRHVSQQLGSL